MNSERADLRGWKQQVTKLRVYFVIDSVRELFEYAFIYTKGKCCWIKPRDNAMRFIAKVSCWLHRLTWVFYFSASSSCSDAVCVVTDSVKGLAVVVKCTSCLCLATTCTHTLFDKHVRRQCTVCLSVCLSVCLLTHRLPRVWLSRLNTGEPNDLM